MGAQTYPSRPTPKGTPPQPMRRNTRSKQPGYGEYLLARARARRLKKGLQRGLK